MDKLSNAKIRILLSEGSSTNVREMISALGPLGYRLDICDPNPLCLGRFSKYIRRVYRCPVSGKDPLAYLQFVTGLLKRQHYDVLFPANEQAYLFAWAKDRLTPLTGLAVADFAAFNQLQTKTAFMRFLDRLDLPHPFTRFGRTWPEIENLASTFEMPFYVKTAYGTASTGVWRVSQAQDLISLKAQLENQGLLDGQTEFLIQAAAGGVFEQSHAIFDHGTLIGLHCTRRLTEGAGGGAIVKAGVQRPVVRRHFEQIGQALAWHGSLSIDYFYDLQRDQPSYIDANPRITEPMNAVVNGLNLAELQVRLSLGETLAVQPAYTGVQKSHAALQAVLGAAARRQSRRDVLAELWRVVRRTGIYQSSQEGMTPIRRDPPALLPLGVVIAGLLCNPSSGPGLAQKTIGYYSLGAEIVRLAAMHPGETSNG